MLTFNYKKYAYLKNKYIIYSTNDTIKKQTIEYNVRPTPFQKPCPIQFLILVFVSLLNNTKYIQKFNINIIITIKIMPNKVISKLII